jgi:hypothetical protein
MGKMMDKGKRIIRIVAVFVIFAYTHLVDKPKIANTFMTRRLDNKLIRVIGMWRRLLECSII